MDAAKLRLKDEWLAREDEWRIEKETALHEEKEKLKEEFKGHRTLLHNKLTQFEEELKLNYAQKESELEAARRASLEAAESDLKKELETEKELLRAQAETGRRDLEAKAAALRAEAGAAETKMEERLSKREEELKEKLRRKTEETEAALEARLETEKVRLAAEFSARAAAADLERLKILEEKAALEEAHAAKMREVEAAAEDRIRQERVRTDEAFRARELTLQASEAELDKLKSAREQQHSDLKASLYRELQAKEHELFGKVAAVKEEMYKAINSHREVLDKEHEDRLVGLLQKETQLQAQFEEKLKAAEAVMQQRVQDEAEKLYMAFEGRKTELDAKLKNREQALAALFSEKEAKLEAEAAAREKAAMAAQEKLLEMRRQEIEDALVHGEKELEAKHKELSEKLYPQYHSERLAWESQKLEALNSARQSLRADFEKKEMLLNQKLDSELIKHRTEALRREEEFAARKTELEKNYYSELERGRAVVDKMRKEQETALYAKFKELDEEQNRLTIWVLKKEEEYIKKGALKEQALQHKWEESEAALKESYERRIAELEQKARKPSA